MKRTDLIYESGIIEDERFGKLVHKSELHGTSYTDINADDDVCRELGLRKGRYITVFADKGDVTGCISELLGEMIPDGAVLAAGLGNADICSDSIGSRALRFIPATAHLSSHPDFHSLGMRKVYVLEAGVMGKTGFESSSRVISAARSADASCIIAIDSLACSEPERLCTTVQITDTGIAPGSGVGNDRKVLDRESAGIPVIAVGVPTVIDLDTLTGSDTGTGLMVTPRSVDVSAAHLSDIIGHAVSRALNPSLTAEELDSLIV